MTTRSKTANVSMTDAHSAFIDSLLASGRYANVSEIMRAGLRLLQRQEAYAEGELLAMQKAWDEGIASGPAVPLEPLNERLARFETQRRAARKKS